MADGPIDLDEARRRKAKASRAKKAPLPRTDDDTRPTVTIRPGELPRMVTETERAIIKAGLAIYQRAGSLVTTGIVPIVTSEQHEIEAQQIVPLGIMLSSRPPRSPPTSKNGTPAPARWSRRTLR